MIMRHNVALSCFLSYINTSESLWDGPQIINSLSALSSGRVYVVVSIFVGLLRVRGQIHQGVVKRWNTGVIGSDVPWLARLSGLQGFNMGHNSHGINMYGVIITRMGN